ncbi:MAG: PilZ domain-containing protein [Acidobacteriaceae bacterium]
MDKRDDIHRLAPGNLEERSAVRFPLALPVSLMASDKLYEATTENISANGVLLKLKLDEVIAPGTNVDFLIQVAEGTTGPDETAAIHCLGRVVRAYEDGSAAHAAAIIDEYRFQSEEEPKTE